jgi:hypothetical protein
MRLRLEIVGVSSACSSTKCRQSHKTIVSLMYMTHVHLKSS